MELLAQIGAERYATSVLTPRGVSATPEARIDATYAYYATPEVRRALGRIAALLSLWLVAIEWILLRR